MRGAKHKEVFEISDLRRREILHLRSVCPPGCVCVGGGGGVLLYLHTYAGSDYFFVVQNSEFQYFFFQKTKYFWGMKILWKFFLSHNIRGHFYAF